MKTPYVKKLMYFIAIYKNGKDGYWSRFCDFPAADQGETIEETILNSTIFLDSIIQNFQESKSLKLPKAMNIDEFKKNLDPKDGDPVCITPIFVYPPSPTVRIQLTGKANQIEVIDNYAKSNHLTRSDLMITATLNYIQENAV